MGGGDPHPQSMEPAITLALPIPDVFAAAYFAACVVIGGAVVGSVLIVAAYLWQGGE